MHADGICSLFFIYFFLSPTGSQPTIRALHAHCSSSPTKSFAMVRAASGPGGGALGVWSFVRRVGWDAGSMGEYVLKSVLTCRFHRSTNVQHSINTLSYRPSTSLPTSPFFAPLKGCGTRKKEI
jgi:hypothetical protein